MLTARWNRRDRNAEPEFPQRWNLCKRWLFFIVASMVLLWFSFPSTIVVTCNGRESTLTECLRGRNGTENTYKFFDGLGWTGRTRELRKAYTVLDLEEGATMDEVRLLGHGAVMRLLWAVLSFPWWTYASVVAPLRALGCHAVRAA